MTGTDGDKHPLGEGGIRSEAIPEALGTPVLREVPRGSPAGAKITERKAPFVMIISMEGTGAIGALYEEVFPVMVSMSI